MAVGTVALVQLSPLSRANAPSILQPILPSKRLKDFDSPHIFHAFSPFDTRLLLPQRMLQSLTRSTGGSRARVVRLVGQPAVSGRSQSRARSAAVDCVSLLPRPLTYSTRLADADPHQIAELWRNTLGCEREPGKIMTALRHSFSMVLVLDEDAGEYPGKIVGIGRAVSDGAFVATVCDVAVLPEYQKRGIGRRIVRELVKDMKRKGPSGFAAFPPPLSRRFFWHLGFRPDKKYRLMAYQGRYLDYSEEERSAQGTALGVSLGSLLKKLFQAQGKRSLFRHGEEGEEGEEQLEGTLVEHEVHKDKLEMAIVVRQLPSARVPKPEKELQPQ